MKDTPSCTTNMNFWINKKINYNLTIPFFKWYEVGALGCAPDSKPYLDLQEFIPWPNNQDEIKKEILENIKNYGKGVAGGHCLIPYHVNQKEFISTYEYYWEKYFEVDILSKFTTKNELDSFVLKRYPAHIWHSAIHLKNTTWVNKHIIDAPYQHIEKFPLLINWFHEIENVLFETTGRIVIYSNLINNPIPIHRDFPISTQGHSSHFVILQFDNRLPFVYDEVKKEKIYIHSKAYMFNECDCHGVEPDDFQTFTIRIDGTFQPWLQKKLNLIEGKIFDYRSKSFNFIKNLKVIEPI